MPRRPRVFVDGAIYHVCCRAGRGERPFAEENEAAAFCDLVRTVKQRDGFIILAWCLMPNHYHLLLRTAHVPLARSMRLIQGRFARAYNRRHHALGALWQERYKAKLVDDERYLLQLIAYVHLNPVAAGVVRDPARFAASAHREFLGEVPPRLVEVDAVLKLFGKSSRSARRGYLELLQACRKDAWVRQVPGGLPWWQREADRPLPEGPSVSLLDPLGRSPGPDRRRFDAAIFVNLACKALGVPPTLLSDGGKDRQRSEVRYLAGGLAIERWRIRAGELGAVVGRRPEVISRWAAQAATLRQTDAELSRKYEHNDVALAARSGSAT